MGVRLKFFFNLVFFVGGGCGVWLSVEDVDQT